MAFEDVDYCLRVWESGRRVLLRARRPAHPLRIEDPRPRPGSSASSSRSSTSGRSGATGSTGARRASPTAARGSSTSPRTWASAAGTATSSSTSTGLLDRGHHPQIWSLADAPTGLVRPARSRPALRRLRRAARRPRAPRRDQGGDVVGDRSARLGGRPDPRRVGLPRLGHRNELLRRHRRPRPRVRVLPPGVHLPDDLGVEPPAAARRPCAGGHDRRLRGRPRPLARPRSRALGQRDPRPRPWQPTEELPAHARCLPRYVRSPARAVAVRHRAGDRRGPRGPRDLPRPSERPAGQRAAQHLHRLPADIEPRGLLPADPRGDGGRRARRVHGRRRQPGLLRRRRQLPHARRRSARRARGARARCCPTPSCASGSGPAAARRRTRSPCHASRTSSTPSTATSRERRASGAMPNPVAQAAIAVTALPRPPARSG